MSTLESTATLFDLLKLSDTCYLFPGSSVSGMALPAGVYPPISGRQHHFTLQLPGGEVLEKGAGKGMSRRIQGALKRAEVWQATH